jgi:hypothetical protein
MSTYEGEHTIFGLLGQANLTQNGCYICLNLKSKPELATQKVDNYHCNFLFILPIFITDTVKNNSLHSEPNEGFMENILFYRKGKI